MPIQKMIAVTEYCKYHSIDKALIEELHNNDLLILHIENRKRFIPYSEIRALEGMLRIIRDLEVNTNGLATILHMMKRMEAQRQELVEARRLLAFYEDR